MKFTTKLFFSSLLLTTASTKSYSQDYKIETISPIVGDNESALITDGGSMILGLKATSRTEELFTYDWKSKKKINLKGFKITYPRAVNKKGIVVGTTDRDGKGDFRAAVWNPAAKMKGKFLDLLSSSHNIAEAFSVNADGKVVGYSGIQDVDDQSRTFYRPFIYSEKSGLKEIPLPANESWAAMSINDAGEILAYKFDGSYSYDGAIIKENGKVIRRFKSTSSIYLSTDQTNASNKLVSSTQITQLGLLVDITNKKTWEPGKSLPSGRGDYGLSFGINESLTAVGYKNGTAYISTQKSGDTPLTCLVPRNQSLRSGNHALNAGSLIPQSVQGIDNAGNIVFTGDQTGDGLGNKIYVAKKVSTKSATALESFCPTVNIKLACECKNSTGQAAICKSETTSGAGKYGYLSIYDALTKNGGCEVSVSTHLRNKSPLIPIKLEGAISNVCNVELWNKRVGAKAEKTSIKPSQAVSYSLAFDDVSFPKDLWQPSSVEFQTAYDPTSEDPAGCFIK